MAVGRVEFEESAETTHGPDCGSLGRQLQSGRYGQEGR